MTLSLSHFRRRDIRIFAAGLLLAAILFRAMVPPGYMPDLPSLQQGLFKITICTAQGAANLLVGPDGQPGTAKKHSVSVCPYMLAGGAFLLALDTPQLITHAIFILTHTPAPADIAPNKKYFGNASPRSPPGV